MPQKRKRGGELSHAEIWDDSALQESWNDALEEYKMYHSISAKGEDVEQVLRDVEEADSKMEASNGTPHDEVNATDVAETTKVQEEVTTEQVQSQVPPEAGPAAQEQEALEGREVTEVNGIAAQPYSGPSMPQIGPQDKSLHNLMMSWYYAGYYTGYYEGQQQAKSAS